VDKARICRLCGSPEIEDLGAIPDSDFFAGRILPTALAGGRLLGCVSCNSMFRHPVLDAPQYMELYARGDPNQWDSTSERRDLAVVRSMIIEDPHSSSVLDIGCGTGEFLSTLPDRIQKFGVEPSGAAGYAVERGIQILADQVENLPAGMPFSVITLIDVIEHVVAPASLLEVAYGHLAPGGKMIVSTGDPDNFVWRRLLKSRFWYSSFPEHITFPSVGFCKWWCELQGAAMDRKVAIRYKALNPPWAALSLLMQAAFFISPAAFSWVGRAADRLRGAPSPRRQTHAPGIPGLLRDHQVLVLVKPSRPDL
jgi:SAM-dependent methyltransferase